MNSNVAFVLLLPNHFGRKIQDPIRLTITSPNLIAQKPDCLIDLIKQIREGHQDFSQAFLAKKDAFTAHVEFDVKMIQLVNQRHVFGVEVHRVVPFWVAFAVSVNRCFLPLQMLLLLIFLHFVVEDGDHGVDRQLL